jgi:hypothetical protein
MADQRKFDDMRFALVENLTGDAKKAADNAGISSGLVAVGVKYGSPGVWSVEKVTGSPTKFVMNKAHEEGLDIKKAFSVSEAD